MKVERDATPGTAREPLRKRRPELDVHEKLGKNARICNERRIVSSLRRKLGTKPSTRHLLL